MPKLRRFLLTLVIMACLSVFGQTYDVIIRGGHVIDGAGNPWIKADVGIRAGRIVAVGRLADAQASRVSMRRAKWSLLASSICILTLSTRFCTTETRRARFDRVPRRK
jgi:hypothetical protein